MIEILLNDASFEQDIRELLMAFYPGETFTHKCNSLCAGRSVLYVSGEESERQLKLRAQRLGVAPESLYILSETRLSDILEAVEELKPDILMIDSIQTLYREENDSSPGSVSQVKDCTMTMMHLSKSQGITVFVVGHINKDGNIAGPKVLEHMVDCVLYFEGDPNSSYRLLRAAKNRFGSTNEIGVFEMMESGLEEVPNPSQMLLDGRPEGASGTCVACVMEGTRPVLAEVQALVAKTMANVPRRASDGFDFNRMMLLLAVCICRYSITISMCSRRRRCRRATRSSRPTAARSTTRICRFWQNPPP